MARRVVKTSIEIGRSHIVSNLSRSGNYSRLEPFRTNQRGEQVDKQTHGNNASYVDHRFSSDVLAGDKKCVAKAHNTKSQDKHRRQPDCQIHLRHSSVLWGVFARAMPGKLAWIAL